MDPPMDMLPQHYLDWKTIASCRQLADVSLISQMKAAGISYGVEIAYRSISKYSC